jgi:hypothetical protein
MFAAQMAQGSTRPLLSLCLAVYVSALWMGELGLVAEVAGDLRQYLAS